MKKVILSFAVLGMFLSGCAVGPLVSHETARTVGDGNHELVGGFGQAGYAFKWNYGLSDNLDLGLHYESLSIGLRSKYVFIKDEDNWSVAGALGTGASVGGSHYYGDVIASYLTGAWEPYGTIRIVHVKNDPSEFRNTDTGQVAFTIDRIEYDYGQLMLGTRYWFDTNWLFSVEASTLFALSSGFKVDNAFILGAAFGYRF